MNKRFSTLLAAALVAGGLSANAQIGGTVATELTSTPARNYMLTTTQFSTGNINNVIATETTSGTAYAKQVTASSTGVNAQLWTIKVKTVAGSNRFVLVNRENGMTLSFDPKYAIAADASGNVPAPTTADDNAYSLEAASSDTEWTWVSAPNATAELDDVVKLTNAFRTDSTMSIAVASGGYLYAYKYANSTASVTLASGSQLELQAVEPGNVYMTPADLNVLGTTDKYFTLSTNKTGLVGADQLIGRKFHAEQSNTTDAVYLRNLKADGTLDDKYAYVDTAFHVGTGTNLNTWYKFANTKTAGDYSKLASPDAFDFFIQRNLFKDSVIVSVATGALKEEGTADATGSKWQTGQSDATILTYLTVSAIKLTPSTEVLTLYAAPKDENLLFSVSSPEADETLTSVEDGVYFIKNKKGQYLAVPVYEAYNEYSGYPVWVTVNPDEQDPAHMPAYQWVALKDKTSDKAAKTSTITLTNREFAKKIDWSVNPAVVVDNDYATIQLRKNPGAEFMYVSTFSRPFYTSDSLAFNAVPTTALSDTLLGYKNIDANDLLVNRYTFNYLHAYTMDKFIAKSAKDSLATVLDGKAVFALEADGAITDYGYDVTKAGDRIAGLKQLRRQAYKVYVPAKNDAYLGVNSESKYAISANMYPSTFFFKENNDLTGDDNCYHAMIELNNSMANTGTANEFTYLIYSKAGVTDDDLSATLKNQVSSETRTSAFLIGKYDAPLYRRFDSEILEGNAGDAADTLRFKEKYRNEYLQVENNENFKVKGIDFLGIYTPDFTKDGKSFIVDTAFVNRWNGNIKPQYLISIDRKDQAFEAGDMCPVCQEIVANGGTRPANCPHDKAGKAPFHMGKYLVNFADSVDHAAVKATNYGWKGYTRAGFVKAAHMGDSLYILTGQFADVTLATFDTAAIHKAVKDNKYAAEYIVNLQGDDHKYVTWSMRYLDPENAANEVEEDRAFLMESMADDAIAPVEGSWLKMQNGCIVMSGTAGAPSTFDQFTNDDDALIFNIEKGSKEDLATDNEEITTSEISVIAGEGQVTIAGAAGKKVVISNILGQVVANTVIASDNAVIAAPQGVVVVAVEGEEAVKAIIK
ncbi:DUF6383 domain-containing protein [uncultured Parabacteroides sp.]|jgi:hypothetical protein|uniref:DUF6383 domain-containing protein n=1 Tax=uncultured Parabacteroides sp. TaxID=512312 RepID=UPI00262DACE6|nr:DUF6383 domain-containing protein [uncultured Parabacteroides sp.]